MNVQDDERARIRALFRRGLRLEEIVVQVGRCMSVVERSVRGLKRRKLRAQPSVFIADRDAQICGMVRAGHAKAEVARLYGITPTRVAQIVKAAQRRKG